MVVIRNGRVASPIGPKRQGNLQQWQRPRKDDRLGRSWDQLGDEELLDFRLCDLPLRISGTALEPRLERLLEELTSKNIRFRPHAWLAEEWFTPDGVPGIAIPFYLTHPRLMQLERRFMLKVEGGSEQECMRILRHEAGHAIDNAYRLHYRRRWRELFGSYTETYPEFYKPRPNSRRYVLHLDGWYAQAHPAEDFAETFAVWLTPGYPWRRRYENWPALEKLEYIEELMQEIAGQPPRNKRRRQVEPLSEARLTLREHYQRKREHYAVEFPAYYDRDLRRVFRTEPATTPRPPAASFLRAHRRELCEITARATGVHPYTINHILESMIGRCRHLKLRVTSSPRKTREDVLLMLTVHTMHVAHSGYFPMAV